MDTRAVLACAIVTSPLSFRQELSNNRVKRPVTTNKVYQLKKEIMTPEALWELGRVSAEGLSPDGRWLVYGISNYTFKENKSEKNLFVMPSQGGKPIQLTQKEGGESVVQITEQGEVIYVYQGQLWSQPLAGGEA